MTAYPGASGGTVPVTSSISGLGLQKGDSQYLFGTLATSATQLPINDSNVAFEAAPAGASVASISVNIQAAAPGDPAPSITIDVAFSGAPGAGESIAVLEADVDADADYITPTNATYTINTFNTLNRARADFSPTGGKFIRVLRTKGANAVGCTVKITRLS